MSSVADIIRRKAAEYGVDPTTALAFAQIESGLKPGATNGGHSGLYQFNPDWWARYGNGGSITDPEANADAFMRYYKESLVPAVTKALGRHATAGELYLAHQQGLAGGPALLQGGDQPAADALAAAYGGGPEGLRRASAAITANGGDPNAPASQFASMWNQRVAAAGKMFDPGFDAGSAPISTVKPPAMAVASLVPPAPPPPPAKPPAAGAAEPARTPKALAGDTEAFGLGLLSSGPDLASAMRPQAPPLQAPQAIRPQVDPRQLNPFLYSLFG